MIAFLLWLLLLVLCWPLALAALVLYPIVWLLLLPLRLVGVVVEGVFVLLRALILLPVRALGSERGPQKGGPASGRKGRPSDKRSGPPCTSARLPANREGASRIFQRVCSPAASNWRAYE